MNKEPYGVTIFCDDIRTEVGGKNTYVGVYQRDLNAVSELPFVLPSLCAAVRVVYPTKLQFEHLHLIITSVSNSEEKEVYNSGPQIPPTIDSEAEWQYLVLHAINNGFRVERSSDLFVKVGFDKLVIDVGFLQIRVRRPEKTEAARKGS